MKRFVGALIVGIFMLGIISATTCLSSDNIIMKLYRQNNSHAALWDDTLYDWDICYNGDAPAVLHPECTEANSFLWLSNVNNSHASITKNVDYDIGVCYGDLVCRAVVDPEVCGVGEVTIVRLFREINSHLSYRGDTSYPWKICCVMDPYTSDPEIPLERIRWENANGVPINSANLGETVRMVKGDSVPGDFEIFEQDGERGGTDDDSIRTISGVVENGNLVGIWEITLDDFSLGVDGAELDDGQIEAFFKINGEESGNLNISQDYIDHPMDIEIVSPLCGEDIIKGETSEVRIDAFDDNIIEGNVSIGGLFVGDIVNGVNSFEYTWEDSGNVPIEVFAVNDRGYERRMITNVMVVELGVTRDYIAACIDEPADFSDITSSNVSFDARSSRGLKCINPSSVEDCEVMDHTNLWYSWKFSDGSDSLYHNGSAEDGLAYKFNKNFAIAGPNQAILDVRFI